MSEKENKIKQVGRAFEDLKNYIINNFDNYKDNEFLIIDWENLNNYDSNLATMILEKPEKTIEYIKKIICQEKKM